MDGPAKLRKCPRYLKVPSFNAPLLTNFCSDIKIYDYTIGMPDVALHGCIRELNDMGFGAFVAVSIMVMFVGNALPTCRSFRFVYFA